MAITQIFCILSFEGGRGQDLGGASVSGRGGG